MPKYKLGDKVKTKKKFELYTEHHGEVLSFNANDKLYRVKFTNGLTTNFFEDDLLFLDEIEVQKVFAAKKKEQRLYDDEDLRYDLTEVLKKIESLKTEDAFKYYIKKINDIHHYTEQIKNKYQREYDSIDQVSKKMIGNLNFLSILESELDGALYSLESLIDDEDEECIYLMLKNNFTIE